MTYIKAFKTNDGHVIAFDTNGAAAVDPPGCEKFQTTDLPQTFDEAVKRLTTIGVVFVDTAPYSSLIQELADLKLAVEDEEDDRRKQARKQARKIEAERMAHVEEVERLRKLEADAEAARYRAAQAALTIVHARTRQNAATIYKRLCQESGVGLSFVGGDVVMDCGLCGFRAKGLPCPSSCPLLGSKK